MDNRTIKNLPWVHFILSLWLSESKNTSIETLFDIAQRIGALEQRENYWSVNEEWFNAQINEQSGLKKLITLEEIALSILGIGELAAHCSDFNMRHIAKFVKKSLLRKNPKECLEIMTSIVMEAEPAPKLVSPELQSHLQLLNQVKRSLNDLSNISFLLDRGPRFRLDHNIYGLGLGVFAILRFDAPAVGEWLKSQTEYHIIESVLYACQYSALMFIGTGYYREIISLLKAQHPFIFLTGMFALHTATEQRTMKWTISAEQSFVLAQKAHISKEEAVLFALYRYKKLSCFIQIHQANHKKSKAEYRYACANKSEELIQHRQRLKHDITHYYPATLKKLNKQKEKLAACIYSHWPKTGIINEILTFCKDAIEITPEWIDFILAIPVEEDRNFLINAFVDTFIKQEDILPSQHDFHSCYLHDNTLEKIELVAKALASLPCKNIGRNFGNRFFSKSDKSLRPLEDVIYTPYPAKANYRIYLSALNRLLMAHSLALFLSYHCPKNMPGVDYLQRNALIGALKTITASRAGINVSQDTAHEIAILCVEALMQSNILSEDELSKFINHRALSFPIRSMLAWQSPEYIVKHQGQALQLLEQAVWPPMLQQDSAQHATQAWLAFDLAITTAHKLDDRDLENKILKLWENGIKKWEDPIPCHFKGTLRKVHKALGGDSTSKTWLLNSPFFKRTFSAVEIKQKI